MTSDNKIKKLHYEKIIYLLLYLCVCLGLFMYQQSIDQTTRETLIKVKHQDSMLTGQNLKLEKIIKLIIENRDENKREHQSLLKLSSKIDSGRNSTDNSHRNQELESLVAKTLATQAAIIRDPLKIAGGSITPDTMRLKQLFKNQSNLITDSLKKLQEQQTAEFRKKLKGTNVINPIFFLILILFLIAGTVMFSSLLDTKPVKGLAMSAGAVLLSFVAEKLFEMKMEVKPDIKVSIGRNTPQDSLVAFNYELGPFIEGSDSLRFPQELTKLSDSLRCKHFKTLNIYGGVDKRQLRRRSRNRFGDNLTLAYNRALFVKQAINNRAILGDSVILTALPMGSALLATDTMSMARSRMVQLTGQYVVKSKKKVGDVSEGDTRWLVLLLALIALLQAMQLFADIVKSIKEKKDKIKDGDSFKTG